MQQYDDPTAVAEMPAPPAAAAPGWMTDGVPGSQGPTVIRGWFMNLITQELLTPITKVGLVPSRTDGTQLWQAIGSMIATAIAGLQTALGYTPVQQGGGPSQNAAVKLNIGWDGGQIRAAQAGNDLGGLALKTDLNTAITNLLGGSPALLSTLNALAAAVNDDPNYAADVVAALALKANLAAPQLTTSGGNYPTCPTPPAGASTDIANMTSVANAQAAAIAAVSHKGNANSAQGPWWDWDPVTGRVEVWGQYNAAVGAEGPIQVNFPVNIGAFQSAWTTAIETNNTGDTTFPVDTWTSTSMNVLAQDSQGGNAATAAGFFWGAIGNSATQPAAV